MSGPSIHGSYGLVGVLSDSEDDADDVGAPDGWGMPNRVVADGLGLREWAGVRRGEGAMVGVREERREMDGRTAGGL